VPSSASELPHSWTLDSMDDSAATRLPLPETNATEYKSPPKRRRKLNHQPHLTISATPSHYKAHDHTVTVRAIKNSVYCTQLQTLLDSHESTVRELIDCQLMIAATDNYRSVCILLDDNKQSEDDRASFLRYIYQSLANTLKKIVENHTLDVRCMNLAFFNNSMCDLAKMQRLRLIDTGRSPKLLSTITDARP
jgi:hypothetical protein